MAYHFRLSICDEAVATNSLHNVLQVVEILFKKLISRFLIASDMGWKPTYSWLYMYLQHVGANYCRQHDADVTHVQRVKAAINSGFPSPGRRRVGPEDRACVDDYDDHWKKEIDRSIPPCDLISRSSSCRASSPAAGRVESGRAPHGTAVHGASVTSTVHPGGPPWSTELSGPPTHRPPPTIHRRRTERTDSINTARTGRRVAAAAPGADKGPNAINGRLGR